MIVTTPTHPLKTGQPGARWWVLDSVLRLGMRFLSVAVLLAAVSEHWLLAAGLIVGWGVTSRASRETFRLAWAYVPGAAAWRSLARGDVLSAVPVHRPDFVRAAVLNLASVAALATAIAHDPRDWVLGWVALAVAAATAVSAPIDAVRDVLNGHGLPHVVAYGLLRLLSAAAFAAVALTAGSEQPHDPAFAIFAGTCGTIIAAVTDTIWRSLFPSRH
jgi:hypothetical protein